MVRLCVPSSSIVACRRESGYRRLSGEAHASTGPRQARVLSIVSSVQWLLLSISTEMKRKSVYAASRNTSHAFTPHLPYSAVCFPKPDLLTSTVALFICPAPGRKLALHSTRWLAVDCSRPQPQHTICHLAGVLDSLQHRYCRLHASRIAVTHLPVPVPEVTHGGVDHQQHPPQTTQPNPPVFSCCTYGNTCICFEAGPALTGCGYSPMCLRIPSVDVQKLGSTIWSTRVLW